MGIFSRFTKKGKDQNGLSQEKDGSSAASTPRGRASFETGLSSLSNRSSVVPVKDVDLEKGAMAPAGSGLSLQADQMEEEHSRAYGRLVTLADWRHSEESALNSEDQEGESFLNKDRRAHFADISRPAFGDADNMGLDHESESDSSGEEGGSEREEEEREENESEGGDHDTDRFCNEGGRFEGDADFYGTKKEQSEDGYRSEGGHSAEVQRLEEGHHYHSEGLHFSGPEVSDAGAAVDAQFSNRGPAHEVTSPPSSRSVPVGASWDQRGEADLPKSDNEALMLAAAWEKEKSKKKPWWKMFDLQKRGDSSEKLSPRSATESERRDISPFSDTAALQKKESVLRRLPHSADKRSERSHSPLWFFHKAGADSGSPTSPPGDRAREFSSPHASEGSPLVIGDIPRPEEPANCNLIATPVTSNPEEGYKALLRREHLRAVPERQEVSWVKEWVSKIEPTEAPSEIEAEPEYPEEPSSPPSWQGNLLLGPSPKQLDAPAKLPSANADTVFANAVASEVDFKATSAYLGARGLKLVPPSLSIFGALKTLDLSRNAIAHIPSGVLPRGLHYLDLSFTKLTAVEGLRELTRLRVLNLHANRIVRIGHGLATCQSLRELHLGGNKIGEVEGLHRLLKLQVLDLSDNKISSTKSLGQLAANYSSLQALNLIGNPVLASVGSDQLRRFIVGLVPQVMYLNKQPLKTVSGRDSVVERLALGSKNHPSSRASKREKHGKSSPLRRGRASTSAVATSSKRSSIGRSKSSSRLAAPPSVSHHHHHHHHHHRSSSQHKHHHGGEGSRHHSSVPREVRTFEIRADPPKLVSPMKPPKHPSTIGTQRDPSFPEAAQALTGFEFNIPRVYSEGAIETPRQLVKQASGDF